MSAVMSIYNSMEGGWLGRIQVFIDRYFGRDVGIQGVGGE